MSSSSNNPMMRIAYEEALFGMEHNEGGPFGAVILFEGRIIAHAHNEVLNTNDPTAHAEMGAIRKASQILQRFDLSDCILYTTGYPCPMCMGAIFWARIPTVYYGATMEDSAIGGFDDTKFYTMIRNPEQALDLRPLDVEKTKKLFEKWNEKSKRTVY